MKCVKKNKKIYFSDSETNNKIDKNLYFKDIDSLILNFDSFEKYYLKSPKNDYSNQLFSKEHPNFELVNNIMFLLTNKDLNDVVYYEFSRKTLLNKNVIENIQQFIPELKKYYLKCKHAKYLENLTEKKVITLFRQILRKYEYSIHALEKYNNGQKYLLYTLEKNKLLHESNGLKKINSTISFD